MKTYFKIFFGTYSNNYEDRADMQANKWLDKNPNYEIIDYKYQQARYGDHSICIRYKEK